MKKFAVCTEARGHRFDVVVEAENLSDAVKIVREKHCAPRMVEVTPSPTWAEPVTEGQDDLDECDEMTFEIHASCEDCKATLFNKKTPEQSEWKWTYASGDEGCYTTICYPCAVKRKEAGNYCAYFKHYYRDDHHFGCDSCPAGGCSKAQERHYEKLDKLLRKAFSFSKADEKVKTFLDNNEFGLAYDGLKEGGTSYQEDFDAHMGEAKALMDNGWW